MEITSTLQSSIYAGSVNMLWTKMRMIEIIIISAYIKMPVLLSTVRLFGFLCGQNVAPSAVILSPASCLYYLIALFYFCILHPIESRLLLVGIHQHYFVYDLT